MPCWPLPLLPTSPIFGARFGAHRAPWPWVYRALLCRRSPWPLVAPQALSLAVGLPVRPRPCTGLRSSPFKVSPSAQRHPFSHCALGWVGALTLQYSFTCPRPLTSRLKLSWLLFYRSSILIWAHLSTIILSLGLQMLLTSFALSHHTHNPDRQSSLLRFWTRHILSETRLFAYSLYVRLVSAPFTLSWLSRPVTRIFPPPLFPLRICRSPSPTLRLPPPFQTLIIVSARLPCFSPLRLTPLPLWVLLGSLGRLSTTDSPSLPVHLHGVLFVVHFHRSDPYRFLFSPDCVGRRSSLKPTCFGMLVSSLVLCIPPTELTHVYMSPSAIDIYAKRIFSISHSREALYGCLYADFY